MYQIFCSLLSYYFSIDLLYYKKKTMDTSPSLSQDETTSTSAEAQHQHDVAVFGESAELSGLYLPTYVDILRFYFYLAERSRGTSYSYHTLTSHVMDKLIDIWAEVGLPIRPKSSIRKKLNDFMDRYKSEIKHKDRPSFAIFVQSTSKLFNISTCKCNLEAAQCSCDSIPNHLKEFMLDQNNERRLTTQQFQFEVEEHLPFSMTTLPSGNDRSSDATFVPNYEEMDFENPYNISDEAGTSQQPERPRGHYSERYDLSNFAMMLDRLGISDRNGSAMGTSILKDFGVKDRRGNPVIVDKSKIRRERLKCRTKVMHRQYSSSTLVAFSFDGRKDDSLTREKIDKNYHYRMVKEPHLVILKEPNSHLLGYTKCEREDATSKVNYLMDFFGRKRISLDALIGICSDGEVTNTGTKGGIIRLFEERLKRPLHWFVCLLHFNELPFRHLFDFLEKSVTTGPRTSTGQLSNDIKTCENLPVCNCSTT